MNMDVAGMEYISTRGKSPNKRFLEIVLDGLAPDGGLYIPQEYPLVTKEELNRWRQLSYPALTLEIIKKYATDISVADLTTLINQTYCEKNFSSPEIITVKKLESSLYVLGLSNGPTFSFKDIAMQLIGNIFEYTLTKNGDTLNVLGATSGDTGSAAEYALRNKKGIRVFMMSPYQRMSKFQTAQMYSLMDDNIINIAVQGTFDDCQTIVKAVSNHLSFKEKYRIGSVNSINWARIVAQIVYYFKGYFAVTNSNDEFVSFTVPSGNFGNVFAGHAARCMGLPIKHLVVATNENDVLDEFFRTGIYRPRTSAETFLTSSPSMDISKASNFERFIFDLVDRDANVLQNLWDQVEKEGAFDLKRTEYFSRIPDFGFLSGKSSHANRIEMIRAAWNKYQIEIDPHTADGLMVALKQRERNVPMICLETALPIKFQDIMAEALNRNPSMPAGLEDIENKTQRVILSKLDVENIKTIIAKHVEESH